MKSSFSHLAPWVGLVAVLAAAADPTVVTIGALQGSGWVASLACVTCLSAGVALVSSGWGAVSAFIWTSGSAYAAGTCLAACADAIL